MSKDFEQYASKFEQETDNASLSDSITNLLQEMIDILPPQPGNLVENAKVLYKKHISKNYLKQLASLPTDIQGKLLDENLDDDEFHNLFQQHISIPILQQALKQLQQKCEIGTSQVEFNKQDIETIFTDDSVKQTIINTLSDDSKLTKHASIFDSQDLQEAPDTWLTFLCNRLAAPIRATQQSTQNKPFLDLGKFAIFGNIDCSGYKMPKSPEDISKLFKILPLGIVGKFDCSGWDKNLFAQIDKLPFAETIDCSFSINSLDDLIGKLPNGLQTLVVQETLIKPNALQNDQEKLKSGQKLLETYPNLVIVDTKGKYNLADTVKQLTTQTKEAEPQTVVKKVDEKPQPAQPVKKQEKTYTIDEVIAMFPETDPEKLHQWIEQEIKDKHKQTDESTGQTLLTQKAVNRIADLVAKDAEIQSQQKKAATKKQEETSESVTDDKTQKSQNIIKIYIKQSDLNKDEDLSSILKNFNVWPQPDHISKKSNNTCCYIDSENKEKLLNGMKFKTTSSLSYGVYASRHDFKIVKLIDIDENGEIKPVLDEFGKEIFVMVCIKYFKSHEKNSKDNREHKRVINGLDIVVTPKPLTRSQQNKFNCSHQNSNNDIKFFALSNLDDSYVQFMYTPYDTDTKPQPTPVSDAEKTEENKETVADEKTVATNKSDSAPKKSVKKASTEQKTQQVKEDKVIPSTPKKTLEPKKPAKTKTLLEWANYFHVMPSFMMLVFTQLVHNSYNGDKIIAQTIGYEHRPETLNTPEKFTVSDIDTLSTFIKSKRQNFLTEKQVVMFNNYRFSVQELLAQCKKLAKTYSETSLQSYFYHIDHLPEEAHDYRTYYFVKKNLPQFIDTFFPDPRTKAKCDLWQITNVAAKLGLDHDTFMKYLDELPIDFKDKWFVTDNSNPAYPVTQFKSVFFEDLKVLLIQTTSYRPVTLTIREDAQLAELKSLVESKSLVDITALEKMVQELSAMLQEAKDQESAAKQEHATISYEISEKTSNGAFDLLQPLYTKAQTATSQVIVAQQNVESVSARFNKAKSLLDQHNTALAEKEAAEKELKAKQETLKSAEKAIQQFLQESINTNQK